MDSKHNISHLVSDVTSVGTTMSGTTIASNVAFCLQSFDDLTRSIRNTEDEYLEQLGPSEITDELGRFRIWAGSMGAHRRGRSSLDYRLRDASHIKNKVQALLGDLTDSIQRTLEILRGDGIPWDKQYSCEDVENEDEDETSEGETELRQLLTSIHDTITFLLRLSAAIQNPAPHDHFMNSSKLKVSQQVFEKFDIAHVCEKFPLAPRSVSETLGKAISRRREYFKYRESHHRKLSEGIIAENAGRSTHEEHQGADRDAETEAMPLSTIASSIPQELKVDENALALEAEQISDSGETQTSFATSTANSQIREIPPVPKAADDGNPFPCPYCFMLITVRSRYSWKRHVFKDLQPYTCTFPSCLSGKRLFERRHEWFQHEMQYHRGRWICQSGCQAAFESKGDFEKHLIEDHSISKDSGRLNQLIQTCEKRPSWDLEISCILCRESLKLKQLERHLGKHQKHLALFALPEIPDLEADEAKGASADDNSSLGTHMQMSQMSNAGSSLSDGLAEPSGAVQKKKGAMFTLSGSSDKDSNGSLETHMQTRKLSEAPSSPSNGRGELSGWTRMRKKGAMFTLGGSSDEDDNSSLENHMRMSQMSNARSLLTEGIKKLQGASSEQTSFKDDRRKLEQDKSEEVFEGDIDEVSESAIEEDDESQWEDYEDDSGQSGVNDEISFQKVDFKPNLSSRRSPLTAQITEEREREEREGAPSVKNKKKEHKERELWI